MRRRKEKPLVTQYEKCKKAKHKTELQEPEMAHIDGSNIYCLDCKRIIGFMTATKSGRIK